MVTGGVVRIRAVAPATALEHRVCQIIRQALLDACLVKRKVFRQFVDEARSTIGARLDELIRCGLTPVHVLDLRVAQGGLGCILELLRWGRVRAQNISCAHREALPTRHVAIARGSAARLRARRVCSDYALVVGQ